MKYVIIPLIIGATGILAEGLKKSLKAKPGKRSVDLLQKTIILGTSYIILKVLSETRSLSGADLRRFKRRSTGEGKNQ
jgi:hypothetical protein